MFLQDVSGSARLLPFSVLENAIRSVLSADGSVNINEAFTEVLGAVSHADRHRK